MKLVFLTRNYPTTICGVGDHTQHLVQQMRQRGVEVSVICFADQKATLLQDDNVFPVVQKWNAKGVHTVVDVVKQIEPDWIIVQYVPHAFNAKGLPFATLLLYNALTRLKGPILTVFHEVKIRPERQLKTKILSFFQEQIAFQLSKMSSKVVTSIDFYADYLKDFAQKMTVIPISSNILPIEVSDKVKQSLQKKYEIAQDAQVICTFGDRDISSYIAAFDKLKSDYPRLIWLICGKNSTPSVILNSRDYIRYVGKMSAENIYRHLALGDVFFMPDDINADGEGGTSNKSGSLACAYSLGIPIVGTKGDLNNCLLKDGKNIILTDIMDTDTLYKALKSGFNSKALALELGHNARQLYDNHLRWEAVAEKFLTIMGQVHPVSEELDIVSEFEKSH